MPDRCQAGTKRLQARRLVFIKSILVGACLKPKGTHFVGVPYSVTHTTLKDGHRSGNGIAGASFSQAIQAEVDSIAVGIAPKPKSMSSCPAASPQI